MNKYSSDLKRHDKPTRLLENNNHYSSCNAQMTAISGHQSIMALYAVKHAGLNIFVDQDKGALE